MRSTALSNTPRPVLDDLQRLGLAIRDSRREKQLTQVDLASRAKLSPTTVKAAERGNPSVAVGILITLLWLVDIGPMSNVLAPHVQRDQGLDKSPARKGGRVRPKRADDDSEV